MYCGSCLRDNALAGALMRLGHRVVLVPLYTPLRTDTKDQSIPQVFMGGVNTWLQHASPIFRHTPRALDWVFDRPWMLNAAGRLGAQTHPSKLGDFVLSILQGEEGPAVKELRRLVKFIKEDLKPDVVSLPNAMFAGMARMIRQETGLPVVCELTGEDIFLDALADAHRERAQEVIRGRARDVSRFVATSRHYAERMSQYLDLAVEQIAVVHPGIDPKHLSEPPARQASRPRTVGYFARICPEKGIDKLVEAFAALKRMPGLEQSRLRAAGTLMATHNEFFGNLKQRIAELGLSDAFDYAGEVDFDGKLAFLDSLDVMSVPAPYAEPKGMYVLEALARGVPVVQPRHGAFTELLEMTDGGLLVDSHEPEALARGIAALLNDEERRSELGRKGRQAVREHFTDEQMARKMLAVYGELRP